MPQPKSAQRPRCEFKEGRSRCKRDGIGAPALCDQHRAALENLGWEVPRPGIGEQLGGMFDQILNGRAPSSSQFEQMAADLAGSLLGRRVTIEEVRKTRGGDYSQIRAYIDQLRARAAAQTSNGNGHAHPFDPERAAKIEYLKSLGRARAVLGFDAKQPLTEQVIKTRHRELAKQHHPDKPGGSTEKMQRVNAATDLLLNSLQSM